MMKRATYMILAFLLCVASSATGGVRLAASDRDHPTPVKSNEIEGDLDNSGDESFYSFTAGRGELTITVDVKSSQGTAVLNFELLDKNADKTIICCEYAQADSDGQSGRDIKSVKLAKGQTVVLHLTIGKTGRGTYRVRFSGTAVARG
jgi:hypothetical protein